MTIEELSIEIFGDENFEDFLEILNPFDGAVQEFKKRVRVIQNDESDDVRIQRRRQIFDVVNGRIRSK